VRLAQLSLILTILLLSSTASGQDSSWDERFEKAMSQEIPSQKIDALSKLSNSEPNFQNRIIAGYNAMSIAYEAQRFETAAKIGERILILTDEHAKGNLKQRDAIATIVINAYYRNDQPEEARRTADENLKMNDAALDDLWAPSNKAIIHRFSGMLCPNQVGKLYRESTRVYHPIGIDVGCDYKAYNGEDNSVSVYFTKYDLNNISSKNAHDDVMETVKVNWGSADLIVDNDISNFTTSTGGQVRESLFRLGSVQKGYRYTGTWTHIINDWILKSRITWDGALGTDFGHTHAKALFNETAGNIKPHLDFCDIEQSQGEAERVEIKSIQTLTSLLTIANTDIDKKSEPRPLKSCMGISSQEGNAIVEWYEDSDRLYSLVGSSINDDVYVSAEKLTDVFNQNEENRYSLKSLARNADTGELSTIILAVYSGRPNQSQVFRDYVAYRNGDLSSLGSVVRDKNGDTQINITKIGE